MEDFTKEEWDVMIKSLEEEAKKPRRDFVLTFYSQEVWDAYHKALLEYMNSKEFEIYLKHRLSPHKEKRSKKEKGVGLNF